MSSVPKSNWPDSGCVLHCFLSGSKLLNSKVHAEAAGPCPQALCRALRVAFKTLGITKLTDCHLLSHENMGVPWFPKMGVLPNHPKKIILVLTAIVLGGPPC
jgi:hypothetical protein